MEDLYIIKKVHSTGEIKHTGTIKATETPYKRKQAMLNLEKNRRLYFNPSDVTIYVVKIIRKFGV